MKHEKKPHPMDKCFFCPDPRFCHEGHIPNENRCLMKNCFCIGFTWADQE